MSQDCAIALQPEQQGETPSQKKRKEKKEIMEKANYKVRNEISGSLEPGVEREDWSQRSMWKLWGDGNILHFCTSECFCQNSFNSWTWWLTPVI